VRQTPLPQLIGFPTQRAPQRRIFSEAGSVGESALRDEALLRLITDNLPLNCQEKWKLRYSSSVHGKSFSRLVERIRDRGPTVIIIQEGDQPSTSEAPTAEGKGSSADYSKHRTASSPRVFGGFTTSPWTTVADRDKEGKSLAAARSRATRNGLEMPEERPANQATQFFGDSSCFIFTSGTTHPNTPEVHRARSNINSNFQYLFDKHPDEDRIGIGMGGKPNFHAWFLDNWLEKGHCRGTRCTTFGNPALCPREEFSIAAVEVYSVDPESWAEEGDEGGTAMHQQNRTRMGTKGTCLEDKAAVNADMMLMEMNGMHEFRCDNVTDEANDAHDESASEEEFEADGEGGMRPKQKKVQVKSVNKSAGTCTF
jgi:hypothetical protein